MEESTGLDVKYAFEADLGEVDLDKIDLCEVEQGKLSLGAKVAVIIPTKNEAQSIGKVIEALKKYDVKIIVVDGNSSDGTANIAKLYNVEVFEGDGMGKGHDIKLFQKYVQRNPEKFKEFDIYVMIDGDYTYVPEDIIKIVKPIVRDEADVVVGSRHDKIKADPGSIYNVTKVGNFLLTRTANFMYLRRDITDICSGYWGFSKDFFENVPILSEKFDLECELFNRAAKNYRLKTVPISFRKRKGYTKLSLLGACKIPFYFMKYFGLCLFNR